jgi:endonuclease YncB( thermonuclease family)
MDEFPPPAPPGPAYCYAATLARVVDGDTIHAAIDLGFDVAITIKVRIAGYDAPEMAGPERPAGLRAKAALEVLLEGRPRLLVQTIRLRGKDAKTFDRYAAVVWAWDGLGPPVNVAESMEAGGFHVAPPGGHPVTDPPT